MKRIIILGGGFGGIRTALDLEKKLGNSAEVILVDKKSYHLFTPDLYEVATAYGLKKDSFAVRLKKTVCIPYPDIFKNKKVNFIQAEISVIDIEGKKIITGGGEILPYDYLVIALGSQPVDFGISGVRDYAFQFKEINDALFINKKIADLFLEISENKRETPLKITVIGAGFTGIELAAELACYIKKISRRIKTKNRIERIMLLEAGPKILPSVSEKERNSIVNRLTELGIEIIENAAAEEVGPDYVKLKNGKNLNSDMVIWTAGVKIADILDKTLGLPKTDKNKIKVDLDLRVSGVHNIFVVGDNAGFIDSKTGKAVPGLAYVAIDEGRIVAENISRLFKEKRTTEFKPSYGVWIAPVGGKNAVAHLSDRINLTSFWGWVVRWVVDFRYLLSILTFKRAVSVFLEEISIFTKND